MCVVCSNRRFVPGAYVSEQLVRAVHCSLKGHDKGIAIENFPRAYKVSQGVPYILWWVGRHLERHRTPFYARL